MSEYQPKFIADAMLGRLAKRLRLMGFDVLYDPDLDDNKIIQRSLEQDRIILTRDTELASRPIASRSILILHDHVNEQLMQVRREMPIVTKHRSLTRCSLCNSPLETIAKQDVLDLVPDQVRRSRKVFFKCTGCGKIYWKGSHVERMTDPTVEN